VSLVFVFYSLAAGKAGFFKIQSVSLYLL